jgi:hypothetical protein
VVADARSGRLRIALDHWAAYLKIEQSMRDAEEAERIVEELWDRERRPVS